jgi:Peptidase family S41
MRRCPLPLLLLLGACAAETRPDRPAATPIPAVRPPPSAKDVPLAVEDRIALFDALMAEVRDLHVFSKVTAGGLGLSWEKDDVPTLRAELLAADTRPGLDLALRHFGNSLHDAHCGFLPSGSQSPKQMLGFDVAVEWRDGVAGFYVDRVTDGALATRVAVGDRVVSVDGVPASELLRSLRFDSNAPTWRGIAEAVAPILTTRRVPLPPRSRWELASREGGTARAVELEWKPLPAPLRDDTSDHDVDFARTDCDGLADRRYGPYQVSARGLDYCLYTSTDARHAAYPIVRHFTFHYDGGHATLQHLYRAEHDNLREQLRGLGALRGVLLDLRDNRGGNNPNVILDWYAPPRAYLGDTFSPRLHPAFATRAAVADLVNLEGAMVEPYLKAVATLAVGGDPFALRLPDFCLPSTCDWDNRHTPSHPVSAAPVALLVGPACASSCDYVARIFSDNDLGPIVGTPTAGVNSMIQVRRPVRARDGRVLGELRLAFSRQSSGKTGLEVEGVPTPPTVNVERTFENRERYDAQIVDEAIDALARAKPRGS